MSNKDHQSDVPVSATVEKSASPVKHTPAPWGIYRTGSSINGAKIYGLDGNRMVVIATITRKADKPRYQKEADAHVLSAAPELLEALKDMRKRFFRCALNAGSEAEFVQLACADADAVIAKAEGR